MNCQVSKTYDWSSIKQQVTNSLYIEQAKDHPDRKFYIDIQFNILYNKPCQKLSRQHVEENLKVLNQHFNQQANIYFTSSQPVKYSKIKQAFKAESVTNSIIRKYKTYTNKINVFVGPLQSQDKHILGISHGIPSHVLFVNWKVFGGPLVSEDLKPNFNQGKTLVHEIGHALSLQHPRETLFDIKEHNDLFDQKQINSRQFDIDHQHNIMNYDEDKKLLHFTEQQILQMRGYLMSKDHQLFDTPKTYKRHARQLDQTGQLVVTTIFIILFCVLVLISYKTFS